MATQDPQLIRLKLRKRWEVAHIRALSASTSTPQCPREGPRSEGTALSEGQLHGHDPETGLWGPNAAAWQEGLAQLTEVTGWWSHSCRHDYLAHNVPPAQPAV